MISDRDNILFIDLLFQAIFLNVLEETLLVRNLIMTSKMIVNENFVDK